MTAVMTAPAWPKAHRTHVERFPAGPLIDAAGGVAALSLLLGVQRRQVQRLRHQGLTATQADAGAVLVGSHPAILWPDLW